MEKTITAYTHDFTEYAKSFIQNAPHVSFQVDLKIQHTLYVLHNAEYLCGNEHCFSSEENARTLLLTALFHDIGRFEQLQTYGTFADALSCNHGYLGLRVLKRLALLKEEHPSMQENVYVGVALHNRFTLPQTLTGIKRSILYGVRDADKVDILRIMAEQLAPEGTPDPTVFLHLCDEPTQFTESILESLGGEKGICYTDMRFVNDIKILLCHWTGQLHFASSKRLLAQTQVMEPILESMCEVPHIQKIARVYVQRALAIKHQ